MCVCDGPTLNRRVRGMARYRANKYPRVFRSMSIAVGIATKVLFAGVWNFELQRCRQNEGDGLCSCTMLPFFFFLERLPSFYLIVFLLNLDPPGTIFCLKNIFSILSLICR